MPRLLAIAAIVSMLVGAGVSYGFTKGIVNGLRARVATMESNRYITREEYDARHAELVSLVKELLTR